ncbi:pilus assembly protein TadB [Brevibacillus sp. NPDC058079]|uniref:pilus assembly protein TadB n=1 Tax=Brevibacillus sp. NPDC058079 TaxID=3346330 RepID=UPI0036EF0A93
MEIIESILHQIGKGGFNLLLIMLMGGSLYFFLKGMKLRRKTTELFNLSKLEIKVKEKKKFELMYFKKLKRNLQIYFFFKDNKRKANIIYITILMVELSLFVMFAANKMYLFALLFPLMIHWFVCKALELLADSIHSFIQKELPLAIKHLIKTMTKTSDLKTVMYETSKNLKEPLRSKFFDLSRKMITENYEKSLMEFAEELDNTWTYAFAFLLLSYKEQSKKTDVIKNLTTLADMMEKENYLKDKSLTDKKSIVILNYCLGVISLLALVANLGFNSYATEFFFNSVGGMISLLIGFTAILGTFLINFVLTKKTF